MPRLIDADVLKEKAYEVGSWMPVLVVNIDDIYNAPTIDAEPVRHGYWIGIEYDGYADGCPVYDLWECSECGLEHKGEDTPSYCPNCGAKMDLEVKDNV